MSNNAEHGAPEDGVTNSVDNSGARPDENRELESYKRVVEAVPESNSGTGSNREVVVEGDIINNTYPETYDLEKYRYKDMIIFNHEQFQNEASRWGTVRDEEALIRTFTEFGFIVETHGDLEKYELFDRLENFCSKDFTQSGCVCAAILTNGGANGFLSAYDTCYNEREVIECFSVLKNPTLFGKPIIILIQASRGTKLSMAISPGALPKRESIELDMSDHAEHTDHYSLPVASDMLIFHSCHIGHHSFRSSEEGSYFIQSLCYQIRLFALVEDFESICRKVRREIAVGQEKKLKVKGKIVLAKQMPMVTSSLLKLLYLRKYQGHDFEDTISPIRILSNRNDRNDITPKITANSSKEKHDPDKQYSPNINAPTYELENFPKNYMIIFNHAHFLDDYARNGTAQDEAALRDTFERFRFHVTTHDDLDKKQLLEELKQFSKQNFNRCGCICVAILTHGRDHGYLRAFDEWYSEREIFACFDKLANRTLVAKPIIFLIEACRGHRLAPSVPVPPPHKRPAIEQDYSLSSNSGGRRYLPSESDMIIVHSSFFGRASGRTTQGTWFIQTLCEQINLHADTEHFEKLNRRVRKIIALEKEYDEAKQVPVTSSTLLRKLFLKRLKH